MILSETPAPENEGVYMVDDIDPSPEHLDEIAAPTETAPADAPNELANAEDSAPLGDVSFENQNDLDIDPLDELDLP